jgi:hypothetical protein
MTLVTRRRIFVQKFLIEITAREESHACQDRVRAALTAVMSGKGIAADPGVKLRSSRINFVL